MTVHQRRNDLTPLLYMVRLSVPTSSCLWVSPILLMQPVNWSGVLPPVQVLIVCETPSFFTSIIGITSLLSWMTLFQPSLQNLLAAHLLYHPEPGKVMLMKLVDPDHRSAPGHTCKIIFGLIFYVILRSIRMVGMQSSSPIGLEGRSLSFRHVAFRAGMTSLLPLRFLATVTTGSRTA